MDDKERASRYADIITGLLNVFAPDTHMAVIPMDKMPNAGHGGPAAPMGMLAFRVVEGKNGLEVHVTTDPLVAVDTPQA